MPPSDHLMGESYCLNCNELLPESAWYCPSCGQKNNDGKISIREFLIEIADALFNIDSKLFRTLKYLFIPGKLTNEYFIGRRKRYAHPFRLFLFTGIIFFTIVSILTSKYAEKDLSKASESIFKEDAYEKFVLTKVDTISKQLVKSSDYPEIVGPILDSLHVKLDASSGSDSLDFVYFELTESFGLVQRDIEMAKIDMLKLDEEELIERYKIEGSFSKMSFVQMLRVTTHLSEFVPNLIQQFIWTFLLMLIILGFILKLIYIRSGRYYIEHLVFSFHFHAFTFITMSLLLMLFFVVPNFAEGHIAEFNFIFLVGFIYLLIAIKRVYKQNWFKTFVKFSIINFSYLILFAFSAVLSSLVTVLIF